MPIVSLPTISGKDTKEIVNAIERQRKEMEFLLANLDDNNILKLGSKKVQVGNSTLEMWSDQIQLSVTGLDDRLGNAETTITQTAAEIELKASVVYVDTALAPIYTDIDGVEQRIASAESSITQNANNIALKVSQTDFNGDTIASLINQSATTITLSAQKINMIGITNVASEFQLGVAGDTDQKSIKFRGSDAWIYSTTSQFTISTMYPVQWYAPSMRMDGIGAIYYDTQNIYHDNCNIDFTGCVVNGLYARFG